MRALDRKLLRNLWTLRGQVVTIALVIAVGIASYVCLVSVWESLTSARDQYYSATRFGDAFAHVERAPKAVQKKLEVIPGVAVVDTRVVEHVMMPMPDLPEPAVGTVIGLSTNAAPVLDDIVLRSGRLPERARADEAVIVESFLQAHRLRLGDTVPVVLNGILRDVRIVGTALSPEYVFAVSYGEFMQDDRRFAVMWMDEGVLSAAMRMEGAFNDVVLRLEPGANEREALARVDDVLRPYGGLGAVPRARQASNFVLSNELSQLERETMLPLLFLVVGAFLLSVVLSRLVQLQRGEIAVLKAIGYRDRDVGLHILELAGVIVGLGGVLGVALGAMLANGMLNLYARYFRFPALALVLGGGIIARASVLSVVAGLAGALGSARRVVMLPPAEAMQPESPPVYRPSLLERIGLGRLFEPVGRMVFRELVRRPLRTALNVLGVALAVAVAITGRISYDMIDTLEQTQFDVAQREDLMVAFRRPLSERAAREIEHLPGVLTVEPMRAVPVRIRALHKSRDVPILAYAEDATLRKIVTWPPRAVQVPEEGVLLTDVLARVLGISVGDRVDVEVLEGARPIRSALVTGLVGDLFGLNAYMTLPALHAMLGEVEGISAVLVSVDPAAERDLEERLKLLPNVARVDRRRAAIERFEQQSAESLWITAAILTGFGVVVALGVVYNAARVALSMRSRDLATLRVLGFSRREIAVVLVAELVVYVALAIGPGFVLGVMFIRLVMGDDMAETFRMPITASGTTFAFAVGVVAAAAMASGLVIRRRLSRLDLVGVLKARD